MHRTWNATLQTSTNSPGTIFNEAYDYTSDPEGESQLCDKIVQAFGSGTCTIKPDRIVIYGEPETTDDDDPDGIKIMINEQGLIIVICTAVIVIIIIAILVFKLSIKYQKNKQEQETKEKDLTMVQTNRVKSMSQTKTKTNVADANENKTEITSKKELEGNVTDDDEICYRTGDDHAYDNINSQMKNGEVEREGDGEPPNGTSTSSQIV